MGKNNRYLKWKKIWKNFDEILGDEFFGDSNEWDYQKKVIRDIVEEQVDQLIGDLFPTEPE